VRDSSQLAKNPAGFKNGLINFSTRGVDFCILMNRSILIASFSELPTKNTAASFHSRCCDVKVLCGLVLCSINRGQGSEEYPM